MNPREVHTKARVPAAERKAGILDAAIRMFSQNGWGSATTSMIAGVAGVNEALIFRHFGSKQSLYLAAIDDVWNQVRGRAEESRESEPAEMHWRLPGRAFLGLARADVDAAQLWSRALAEKTGVHEIDQHLQSRLLEVHEWVQQFIVASQQAGGLPAERKPDAEAWIILSLGWLGVTTLALGGVAIGQFEDVIRSHRSWMTGIDS